VAACTRDPEDHLFAGAELEKRADQTLTMVREERERLLIAVSKLEDKREEFTRPMPDGALVDKE
jgi:hypothetical protein